MGPLERLTRGWAWLQMWGMRSRLWQLQSWLQPVQEDLGLAAGPGDRVTAPMTDNAEWRLGGREEAGGGCSRARLEGIRLKGEGEWQGEED